MNQKSDTFKNLLYIPLWLLIIMGSAFSQVYVNGEKRNLAVTLYDWPETSPDFGTGGGKCGGGLKLGYVAKKLDSEGKPAVGPAACTPTDLVQWFRTQQVSGYSNSTCYDLGITYNDKGLWVADYPSFFPMDDFTHLDAAKTVVNPWNKKTSHNSRHNYSFTMEIDAEFAYKKGQTFDFRGDDDVFVFINNELVVDIGGVHGPRTGNVNLDTLGLVEGTNYSFKIFFAERQESGSSFKMATSMDLKTRRELILKTVKTGNTTKYDINERQGKSKESCSLKNANAAIVIAPSIFILQGSKMTAKQLNVGLNFGGISIGDDSASVEIDLDAIEESEQLAVGLYEIIISHKNDASQADTVEFEVEYEIIDEVKEEVKIDPCAKGACIVPKLLSASVHDLKPDGIAETIKVKFDVPVKDFDGIFSIDWPVEGGNNLSSTLENTSYERLIGGGVDSTTLILDMTSQFENGTKADLTNPPYLNYGSDSVLIEDKMGPVLIMAEQTYPKELTYAVLQADETYEYFETPITITIKTSEGVFLGDSLHDLFLYKNFGNETSQLLLSKAPILMDSNYRMSLFIIPEMLKKIKLLDSLAFSSKLNVKDSYGNPAVLNFVKIEEGASTNKNGLTHAFRTDVVGGEEKSESTLDGGTIKLYDTLGDYIKRIPESVEINDEWVAPYNFKEGKFNSDALCTDEAVLEQFPSNCFSSFALGTFKTAGAYKAKIHIFDHLGQYINSWEQGYGYCGEFDNPDRTSMSKNNDYYVHDLIWNLKDDQGRAVGGGVYIWKVDLHFESGRSEKLQEKMGVLRSPNECELNNI